jgi:pimeloyl-ACP methyl ester carboxylesterase
MNIARGFMGEWGEGFRRIAISRFGYLRTPMPQDGSSAAQADALAAVLDALEVPRAAVIGVSAGAHPTAQFALCYPEKVEALVLAVPALYAPPEPGAPPTIGPPAIITDYVLRSDFLVWLMSRLAPSVLLRAAGAPPSVQRDLSPQGRKELIDGFFPASARHAGLTKDIRNAILGWPDLPIEEFEMPVLLIGPGDHAGARRPHPRRPGAPGPARGTHPPPRRARDEQRGEWPMRAPDRFLVGLRSLMKTAGKHESSRPRSK